MSDGAAEAKVKNPHYYKNVEHLTHIDVYRVCQLFDVVDPCIQHDAVLGEVKLT